MKSVLNGIKFKLDHTKSKTNEQKRPTQSVSIENEKWEKLLSHPVIRKMLFEQKNSFRFAESDDLRCLCCL